MTLAEILPTLQQLSSQDKIKAIQFLTTELKQNDRDLIGLEDGASYEVWSPYDAFSAEKVLTDMLAQYKQSEC